MRIRSILLLACLLTASLVVLPGATAAPCNEQYAGFWGAGAQTHQGCTADVYVLDAYRLCPAGTTDEYLYASGAGSSATVGYCLPDLSASAGLCKENTYNNNGVTVRLDADCHTQVDIKPYDCVWNCEWDTLVDTPALTVRYYHESTDAAQMAAAPACNGIWYFEEDVGPITVWTDGSLDCTGVSFDAATSTAAGKDIYVDTGLSCIWGASYKPVLSTPVATVWVWTCDQPYETS